MAYDKHTWTCNEPITVERLNHIEDGIAAGGDCDCGYECTETLTTLTEESVTTAAQGNYNMGTLSYSQLINADSIKVTFDGVEYECPLTIVSGGYYYGGMSQSGPDFSEYPFVIGSEASQTDVTNFLVTETAGTYSVKIEAVSETVTTTSCFQKAVESLTSPLFVTLTKRIIDATDESPTETPEGSQSNIINALEGGRMVYLVEPNGHKCLVISYSADNSPEIEVMGVDGVAEFNADGSKFYYPHRQV